MSRRLLIATQNEGKLAEFQRLLEKRFQVASPRSPVPDVEENGKSYFENALKKALAFYVQYKVPVLSDDSGLEVLVLGGDPGIYSARYGGTNLSWSQRWDFLYRKLAKFSPMEWKASFTCVLCYFDGKNVPVFFEGKTSGRIVSVPAGERGFGYDPIFYCPKIKKTFGQASPTEKARCSHRARAISAFLTASKHAGKFSSSKIVPR